MRVRLEILHTHAHTHTDTHTLTHTHTLSHTNTRSFLLSSICLSFIFNTTYVKWKHMGWSRQFLCPYFSKTLNEFYYMFGIICRQLYSFWQVHCFCLPLQYGYSYMLPFSGETCLIRILFCVCCFILLFPYSCLCFLISSDTGASINIFSIVWVLYCSIISEVFHR